MAQQAVLVSCFSAAAATNRSVAAGWLGPTFSLRSRAAAACACAASSVLALRVLLSSAVRSRSSVSALTGRQSMTSFRHGLAPVTQLARLAVPLGQVVDTTWSGVGCM